MPIVPRPRVRAKGSRRSDCSGRLWTFAGSDAGRMITGASLHPNGDRLLLRVYTGIYEYRLGPGQTMGDLGAIAPRQVTLGPLSERQGEAVAYDTAGTGVWSVSEDWRKRPGQPLHHHDCAR